MIQLCYKIVHIKNRVNISLSVSLCSLTVAERNDLLFAVSRLHFTATFLKAASTSTSPFFSKSVPIGSNHLHSSAKTDLANIFSYSCWQIWWSLLFSILLEHSILMDSVDILFFILLKPFVLVAIISWRFNFPPPVPAISQFPLSVLTTRLDV